jgi:hypothetical protein
MPKRKVFFQSRRSRKKITLVGLLFEIVIFMKLSLIGMELMESVFFYKRGFETGCRFQSGNYVICPIQTYFTYRVKTIGFL